MTMIQLTHLPAPDVLFDAGMLYLSSTLYPILPNSSPVCLLLHTTGAAAAQ